MVASPELRQQENTPLTRREMLKYLEHVTPPYFGFVTQERTRVRSYIILDNKIVWSCCLTKGGRFHCQEGGEIRGRIHSVDLKLQHLIPTERDTSVCVASFIRMLKHTETYLAFVVALMNCIILGYEPTIRYKHEYSNLELKIHTNAMLKMIG